MSIIRFARLVGKWGRGNGAFHAIFSPIYRKQKINNHSIHTVSKIIHFQIILSRFDSFIIIFFFFCFLRFQFIKRLTQQIITNPLVQFVFLRISISLSFSCNRRSQFRISFVFFSITTILINKIWQGVHMGDNELGVSVTFTSLHSLINFKITTEFSSKSVFISLSILNCVNYLFYFEKKKCFFVFFLKRKRMGRMVEG